MFRIFLTHRKISKVYLLFGDILIISLSMLLVNLLYPHPNSLADKFIYIRSTLFSITLISYYVFGLYDVSYANHKTLILSILLTIAATFIFYNMAAYFIKTLRPGKISVFLIIMSTATMTYIWHYVFLKYVKTEPQKILLIGHDDLMEEIKGILNNELNQHYQVVGHWHRLSHNPTLPNLEKFIQDNNVESVVYSVKSKTLEKLKEPLLKIKFASINIFPASNFYQRLTWKLPISSLDEIWILINNNQQDIFSPEFRAKLKRVFDIFLTLCFLPFALPIILIAGLAIKLETKGPAFYTQERVGLNEVPFTIYKLRTMIADAEKAGPQMCHDNDCRITRVGKILRFFRFDELPQLFNVLKGDMSFTGPRPLRKHFTDQRIEQIPSYELRFLVKPGITGWSQVIYGHANTLEDHRQMFQYDMFYIVHQSLSLDFFIILKTLRVIFWGKGSR